MSRRSVILPIFAVLFSFNCSRDILYEQFMNPPPEARPFVRWWWNGNCVEKGEIARELDIMNEAGIGGIEINPIAMPAEATKTAAAIADFARAGGTVICIETLPSRSPSLMGATENDRVVQEAMGSIEELSAFHRIPAPEDAKNLLPWTIKLLANAHLEPAVKISDPDPAVYQIHKIYEDRDIHFSINSDSERTVSFGAQTP